MSQALNEVLEYSNEDSISIKKHWIIFIKTIISILIESIIVIIAFLKFRTFIEGIADWINEVIDSIPFTIRDYSLLIVMLLLLANAIKKLIITYIEYSTVEISVNNIQIKGKTGLIDIGTINSNLDKVTSIKVLTPFWGRLFNYGNIEISLNETKFTMTYMVNTEKFQEAIVLLQEVQKESRNIRSSNRNTKALQAQTEAQVQALSGLAQTMVQGIAQIHNASIDTKKVELIEENNLESSQHSIKSKDESI